MCLTTPRQEETTANPDGTGHNAPSSNNSNNLKTDHAAQRDPAESGYTSPEKVTANTAVYVNQISIDLFTTSLLLASTDLNTYQFIKISIRPVHKPAHSNQIIGYRQDASN